MRGLTKSRRRWVHWATAAVLAGAACQPVPGGWPRERPDESSAAVGAAEAALLLELVSLCALGDEPSPVDPCSELTTDFDPVWGSKTLSESAEAAPRGTAPEEFDVESLLGLLLEGSTGVGE